MSDQIKVDIDFDEEKADKFPAYCHYAGQYQPQPAYIAVDIRRGKVYPDYNGNIGGGCSPDEWYGLIQKFPIPAAMHRSELIELMNDNVEFFQKVIDAYEEEWNGSNYVAKIKSGVSEEIGRDLEHEWESKMIADVEIFGIIDVMPAFLEDEPSGDIDALIDAWFRNDGECGWFEQESAEDLKEYILSCIDDYYDYLGGRKDLADWYINNRKVSDDEKQEIMELFEAA